MARKVLKDSRISEPPVDLHKIVAAHGIQYIEVEDFPDTVDALIIEDGTKTYAAVNAKQHLHRQRFSVAHELGHYFLHRDVVLEDPVTIDNPPGEDWAPGGKNPAETEADIFAGELLVPLEFLKKFHSKSLEELSKVFLVSQHVVSIALTSHFNALFK